MIAGGFVPGVTTHTLTYAPFGELSTGTPLTRFGYIGEWTDPGGQLYLRARVYQPSTGRFPTRDPIQPNHPGTQGWNHYTYTTNNPTTFVDPSGQISLVPRAVLRGILVGGFLGSVRAQLCPPGDLFCQINSVILGAAIGGVSGGLGDKIAGVFGFAAACLAGGGAAIVEDQAARSALGLEPLSGQGAGLNFALGCLSGAGPPVLPPLLPATAPAR